MKFYHEILMKAQVFPVLKKHTIKEYGGGEV